MYSQGPKTMFLCPQGRVVHARRRVVGYNTGGHLHLNLCYIICDFLLGSLILRRCNTCRLPADPHYLLIYCYGLLISSMNDNVECEFLWQLVDFNKRPKAHDLRSVSRHRPIRHKLVRIYLDQLLPRIHCCWLDKVKPTGATDGVRGFKLPIESSDFFWIVRLHKNIVQAPLLHSWNPKKCMEIVINCILISQFSSASGGLCLQTSYRCVAPWPHQTLSPRSPGSRHFRQFLIHPLNPLHCKIIRAPGTLTHHPFFVIDSLY